MHLAPIRKAYKPLCCERCPTCKKIDPNKPVRIGVLFNGLWGGGVEAWYDSLRYYAPSSSIWSGFNRHPEQNISPELDVETTNWKSWRDSQDVIVIYSVPRNDATEELKDFRGKVAFCSHSESDWGRRCATSWRGLPTLLAVSQRAANVYPHDVRHKVQVIRNGVDWRKVSTDRSRESIRKEWGLGDGPVVLYCGRWSYEKRPEAAALAVSAWPGAKVLACVPLHHENGARDQMLTILPRDRFHIVRNRVPESYKAADVFILGSPSEGASLAMIESWACGLPVVATNVGLLPELKQEYKKDFAVLIDPSATGEQMARACQKALNSPDMVEAAKAYSNSCSAISMAREWEQVLRGTPKG